LHRLSSSFVLGFHGCDQSVADDLLSGKDFVPSANDWDWLGSGIYFWETNPLRGMEFAKEGRSRGKVTNPAVIGAVIDLGFCLDLTSSTGIEAVHEQYLHTLGSEGRCWSTDTEGLDYSRRRGAERPSDR